MRRFLDDAASLVVEHGGSISGEHGDGQSKAELLPKMFGPELIEAFREFKSIWDPDWKMNPGKVVDPFPITSNMRLGPDYVPPHVHTHFSFPNDEGNFSRAAIRCVGVGKCRSAVPGDNVMCPSYMVDPRRSLRDAWPGAAAVRNDAWRGYREDLAQPGRGEGARPLPVLQGMQARLPRECGHGHLQGRVPLALLRRQDAAARRLFDGAHPDLGQGCELRAGPRQLRPPATASSARSENGRPEYRRTGRSRAFAPMTYTAWRRRNPTVNPAGKRVLLFADTFNNYFRPATAISATIVLEAAGWQVVTPEKPLCCGRPLYDWGMLDTAEKWLCQIIDSHRPRNRQRHADGWA